MAKLRTDLQPALRTGLQAKTAPPKTSPETPQGARLASLEGIRCLAALAILLYHAQLYFTGYGYTPQPTGFANNLQRLAFANSQRSSRILKLGVICYGLGFYCQFSRWGWIVADLLLPLGLTACSLVLLGWLEQFTRLRQSMIRLGAHSYSYFLIHNFVVDRTIHLLVGSNLPLYLGMLPIMVVEALLFSILADYTTPLIQQVVSSGWRYLDFKLVGSRQPQQV